LKQHYNYSTSEAIAIGDNYNDVEMLKYIGYGIAVGNARKEAMEAANIVAEKNIEDGIAKSLVKIFGF
jgi:hydroxymethylpyrimidine pyrophosphatase-like HAD family hydrolase